MRTCRKKQLVIKMKSNNFFSVEIEKNIADINDRKQEEN